MKNLVLLTAVVVALLGLVLPSAHALRCEDVFSDKGSTSLQPWDITSDISARKSPILPDSHIKIGEHWNFSSLFGSYEFVIAEHPLGIQVAIIPRANEYVKPIRDLTDVLLAHYFGAENVQYRQRPDGETSEHPIINTSHGKWNRREIKQRIEALKRNLQELPSRVMTSPKAIQENPDTRAMLIEFGKKHFPYVTQKAFVRRASYFIPFFVQKQATEKNMAFYPEIFSTREISGDPHLEALLKVLFQMEVDVKTLREELRTQFINEFTKELADVAIYTKRVEAWEKLKDRPDLLRAERDPQRLIFPASARKYLPRRSNLKVTDMPSWYLASRGEGEEPRIAVYKPISVPLSLKAESQSNIGRPSKADTTATMFLRASETALESGVKPPNPRGAEPGTSLAPYNAKGLTSITSPHELHGNLQLSRLIEELGIETFTGGEFNIGSTPLNRLVIRDSIRQQIMSLPEVRTIEDISRFSAQELVETYGFNRKDMIDLLVELDTHSIHIHFDPKWDAQNMRLRRELPQYYEYKHAPGKNINWYEVNPSDSFLNE